jgi:hypothetical protein
MRVGGMADEKTSEKHSPKAEQEDQTERKKREQQDRLAADLVHRLREAGIKCELRDVKKH